MKIDILQSSKNLTENEVIDLKKNNSQSSETCWFGNPLMSSFQWLLVQDPTQLWFHATIPFSIIYQQEYQEELSYIEGLWNKDVVELFILNSQTGNYLEFNFSPINAWWCCEFESYRNSKLSTQIPKINFINFNSTISSWSVLVAIDLNSLPFPIEANSTLFHISGIVPLQEPVYLTSNTNRSSSYTPDFHRQESFLHINILPDLT